MLRIETFIASPDRLGEGPLWDVVEERLYWEETHAHRSAR